jgi:hypothetical protein
MSVDRLFPRAKCLLDHIVDVLEADAVFAVHKEFLTFQAFVR